MRAYSDIVNEFKCTNGGCKSTCCAGKEIELDEITYQAYQNMPGDFGNYMRDLIIDKNGTKSICHSLDKKCSFVDDSGLCQIYTNCGEDYLCDICKSFPKIEQKLGKHSISSLSTSCEEVLRMIYDRETPIKYEIVDNVGLKSDKEEYLFYLNKLISWGANLLQDEETPFSLALSTVVYLSLRAGRQLYSRDFDEMCDSLETVTDVMLEFNTAKNELPPKELEEIARDFIFNVSNTFATVCKEAKYYNREKFLWAESIFELDDDAKTNFIHTCWRFRSKAKDHERFLRRLATIFFTNQCIMLSEGKENIAYLQKLCNFILVAEILPLTWSNSDRENLSEYFSRIALISRVFNDSTLVDDVIGPTIENVFCPDVLTYAMTFMVLFD